MGKYKKHHILNKEKRLTNSTTPTDRFRNICSIQLDLRDKILSIRHYTCKTETPVWNLNCFK